MSSSGLLTMAESPRKGVMLMNRYDFVYLLTVTLICITIIPVKK